MAEPAFSIRTGREWEAAAKALRAADAQIRKELNAAIRDAAKPIVDEMKAEITSWESKATSTGGGARGRARVHAERSRNYAAGRKTADRRLAKGGFSLRSTIASSIQVKISYSGQRSGVRIRVDSAKLGNAARKLPSNIDKGTFRHPVFGNREAWVTQTGKKGWFSDTAAKGATRAVSSIEAAVLRALNSIT